MVGGGIHVQLPYTVINVWSIHMWGGFLMCGGGHSHIGGYSLVGDSHVWRGH